MSKLEPEDTFIRFAVSYHRRAFIRFAVPYHRRVSIVDPVNEADLDDVCREKVEDPI